MIKEKILYFAKKPFVRNAATVATGTIAVQAISIAFSPIITRLYGPENFGILGVFVTLLSIITPVATMTYVTAIVLPDKESEAIYVAKLSLFCGFIVSFATGFIFLLFGNLIVETFQLHSISQYLFLIPILVFFVAGTQIFNQWLIRENQYRNIAKISIIQVIIVNLSKACVGIFYATAASLILIASLGHILQCQMFKSVTKKKIREDIKLRYIFSKRARQAHLTIGKKFKDFPLYRAPQVMFNALTKGIPILLLASFFGPAAAGFYSIGNRLMKMPAGIIGKSIGNVYYPRIAKAANNLENLKPYILKGTLGMAALAFFPLIILALLGPWLFEFVFGSDWTMAGHYARWLSILVFFEFILNPGKDATLVMGFQKQLLFFEIISMVFKVAALFAGFILLKNDLSAIIIFSLTGAILCIFFMVWIFTKAAWKKPGV